MSSTPNPPAAKITADNFAPEHFDKLIRGLGVAKERLEDVLADLSAAKRRNAELVLQLEHYERDAADCKAYKRLLTDLCELVEDMGRGIRTADEVLEWVADHPAA